MKKEVPIVQPSALNPERPAFPEGFEVIRPTGVDLFLAGLGEETSLPAEIANHPGLLEQAASRRELYLALDGLFKRVSDVDMDASEAVDRGLISSEDLTGVYQNLADFIEADENHGRIILYLPFEILPGPDGSKPQQEKLASAQERFRDVYRKVWIRLLHESDVRASFVDGDVLEPWMGTPPRVRKAAHLIPEMLKRGIISTSDIIEQLEISSSQELLQSLTEGFVVAADRKLTHEDDWRKIQTIAETKPVIDAVLKTSQTVAKPGSNVAVERADLPIEGLLENVASRLKAGLAEIESRYKAGSPYVMTMSPKRAKWEKRVEHDEVIDRAANELAKKLQNGKLSVKEIESFCEKQGSDEACVMAGLRSIIMTGERLAADNLAVAQEFATVYQSLLQKLWEKGSHKFKDVLVSGLAHWRRLDIVGQETLDRFGIQLPDLASPFPVDPRGLISKDLKHLIEAAKKIEEHAVLSNYIYPVVLVFGSAIKGYASPDADLDAAIFIKPGTSWEKREEILKQLQQEIPELAGVDDLLEYWIRERGGKFTFREAPERTSTVVGAPQVHFILGGMWFGRREELRKICGDILKGYLDLERFGDQKNQVRTHLLRQIELDVLQYRLMHKGYRRFYPNKRGPSTEHAYMIDWESDFWDPGYRRVAAQLFLSRVFLPDLPDLKA